MTLDSKYFSIFFLRSTHLERTKIIKKPKVCQYGLKGNLKLLHQYSVISREIY